MGKESPTKSADSRTGQTLKNNLMASSDRRPDAIRAKIIVQELSKRVFCFQQGIIVTLINEGWRLSPLYKSYHDEINKIIEKELSKNQK